MNSNQKISADRVIDYLHSMDIDGEVMEYILNGAHMTEQMLRQLVMKAPNEDLDNIIAERNSLKAIKQTAVEWLLSNLEVHFPKINEYRLVIELAKQMEKEQHQKTFQQSRQAKIFEKDMPPVWESWEQYYSENFSK